MNREVVLTFCVVFSSNGLTLYARKRSANGKCEEKTTAPNCAGESRRFYCFVFVAALLLLRTLAADGSVVDYKYLGTPVFG